jgi:adenylate kinase
MNILIMGPAGAGKGTMSDRIIQDFDIPHISTGDMLRENVRNNTELGLQAKSYMDAGKLVPDELIIAMVEDRIQKPDANKGYLLDGFPRTLVQAETFEKISNSIEKAIDIVIALDVEFDTLARRITGRRICPNCKEIYHIDSKPTKVDGICDKCGTQVIQRSDDTIEQLKVRMDEYENSTKPVIDYYSAKGLVYHINASQSPDEVYAQVKEALGKVA